MSPVCQVCLEPLSGKTILGGWRCDSCKRWRNAVVRYTDHVAEVERRVTEALEVDGWQRLAENRAAEAMRAACIKAVTDNALQDTAESGEGLVVKITLGAGSGSVYINRDRVLAALREVQP